MKPTDILGNIKLYNADCMEVMKTFKDKQFDLAIVDPPYKNEFNITANGKAAKVKKHYDLNSLNNSKPTNEYFNEIKLRCMQYKIDFIEADINEGFDKIMSAFLAKRRK